MTHASKIRIKNALKKCLNLQQIFRMPTFANTFKTLLIHRWLGFRRSHHFERSLGTRAIILFVAVTMIWYLFYAAMMLPRVLELLFPGKTTLDAFFSLLLYMYASDLILRYFMQKVPRQQVQAYLHLPVKRIHLTSIMMLRSWASIYNVYLLALLVPFFFRTLYIQGEIHGFWLATAGCFLMGGINNAIIMWLKTKQIKEVRFFMMVLLAALIATSALLFREQVHFFSEMIGRAFIQGNPLAFALPLVFIGGLQTQTVKALSNSLYALNPDAPISQNQGTSRIEKLFHNFPAYGPYWDLEWKLLNRNKRASRGFRQWPLTILIIPLMMYSGREDVMNSYMILFLMFSGSYGFFHLQYVYSWESRFFDFIASKKFDIYKMILSKYYFYLALAILQLLVITPAVYFLRPSMVLPMVGFMLYVTGLVFLLLFNLGIGYSTRIDPNRKAFFNTEGTSGTQFMTILLIMFSYLPFMAIAFALPMEFKHAISLVFGSTGLAFIASHRYWIQIIANKFTKRKYIQLKKYREK
jgi:hypothetical protein